MSGVERPEVPDRLEVAGEVLRRWGLAGCRAAAAGNDAEVLLLSPCSEQQEATLLSRALAEELREAGFRYVALDLAPSDAQGDA